MVSTRTGVRFRAPMPTHLRCERRLSHSRQRRSEEHTSELQSRFDLVTLHSVPPRRSSDLMKPPLRTPVPTRLVPRGPRLTRLVPRALASVRVATRTDGVDADRRPVQGADADASAL